MPGQPAMPQPKQAFPKMPSGDSAGPPSATTTSDTELGSIPESQAQYSWYATPGASATDSAMSKAGVAAALSIPLPFRGSIISIGVAGTAAMTGGALDFNARLNGVKEIGTSMTGQRKVERFAKGKFPFARDDYLDVVFTTNAGYAPTTTVYEVTVGVVQDSAQAI